MRFITESNPRWERFAAREPYFAVLTDPRFLRANFDDAASRDFFQSGEALVGEIIATADKVAGAIGRVTALEYGCGAGRLAIPLTRAAHRVTAVDISPAMLAEARENAAMAEVENLAFLTPRELFASNERFDLVTCYLVFQRLPIEDGLQLLRALLDRIGSRGVGVFQFPFRTKSPAAVRASRWLRERIAPVNAAMNVARHRAAGEPFIPTHVYDLAEVLSVVADAGFTAAHVGIEEHGDVTSALVYVHRPREARPLSEEKPELPDDYVDVRAMIATTSIDDLNQAAEEYFARLTTWEHHLAKPFAKPDEAPPILISFAVLVQALRLAPGMDVLEFGAGTGWLSRFLTQLGCRAILLDVSPTALRIARELYERMPVIGERPAPDFLVFDGRRIDLPDESVDRIISFDAFHHAPNPEAVLAELARVLRPGGIAAFAEPGPEHSKTPLSQFEMKLHRVVENDVDIHALWATAQQHGFTKLEMNVFHLPPFHLSLREYEDLLAGGLTAEAWLDATRQYLKDVRHFTIWKGDAPQLDSRNTTGLACEIEVALAQPARAGEGILVDAIVTNCGTAIWLPSARTAGGVSLAAHLYDAEGRLVSFDFHWQWFPGGQAIAPGETVAFRVPLPPLAAGRWGIEFDCVANHVAWFAQLAGGRGVMLTIDVV